ncbi:MAG: flagellar motor switch protein FliN [Candidatus Lambdaproteobacteria bacterium RIFOXYD1_FULL_56_27]|uniref:Flagellar motor switch protein FliN n=1 Tax=Candidatus Lambdaproteobacteria bacterium RIFOXYD2_FULL_56_26 TaxID=1817773 RepID=A0A1F6H428_9PROT|nr:MAG: flagellar motor switch protein FliN [Candidatus Lambdaproteobacteria bacterium RIFOXYC1_FULL_56_13]OGH05128.1 MAG: flagellar motor switch protein FliN [Candidatus Lambdaproteobacteria bacterium RIFOXYD2_FULL_56_26]OGH09592.1 MAG: flagellar motor switch protein FliN [Candidatus Lambdaproteobacteria bacterium RIFOXYD1_FULL_56_27]
MAEEIDPFEAAMRQLGGGGAPAPDAADDPFAAAQAALSEGGLPPEEDPVEKALALGHPKGAVQSHGDPKSNISLDFLMDIKLKVTFEVGRAKMYIADLLSLGQGSVIELHRLVGEELEIYVNGHLLATGEVVVVNEKFGAKITNILSAEERVLRLAVVK